MKLKLKGCYYITHLDNLSSILDNGILCHNIVEKERINYFPIYDPYIVTKRKQIEFNNGKRLGDYANLYFQPRNAMLYRVLLDENIKDDIIIIGIKEEILHRNDIYITDGNAYSSNTKFFSTKDTAFNIIKSIQNKVDKDWWLPNDPSKRELMAECLVPKKVSREYFSEIYVPNLEVKNKIKDICDKYNIQIIQQPEIFFLPTKEIKLTDNLSLIQGDMFFSRLQTLTISVNTVGVMGKGLASRTKYQFPDVYEKYQHLCKDKILKMGKPYIYKRELPSYSTLIEDGDEFNYNNSQTWFLLFPTKTHWRNNSDIKGIEKGLQWLVENYKKEGILSLALPALGCGLGNLSWEIVGPMLCTYLQILDIKVDLFLPLEKDIPEEQLSKEFLIR